ncbi:11845_t:CDS:1, partial [Acaulospora morrowiae]
MMNSTEDIATHSEQLKLDPISTSDNIPQVTIETISSLPNSELSRNNVILLTDTNNKLSNNVDANNKLSEDLPKERKVLSLIADPSSYYEMGHWGAFGRDGKLGFGGIITPRRTMSLTYKKQNSSHIDSGPAVFTSELTRGLAKENHLNADDTFQESRVHQPLDEISHKPTTLSPPSPLQLIYTKDVSDTSGVRRFFHHNRAHSYTPNASGASFPLEIPK